MLLVEQEARRRGFVEIRLNVFGGNETARSLYRSLQYVEFAIGMRKRLYLAHHILPRGLSHAAAGVDSGFVASAAALPEALSR